MIPLRVAGHTRNLGAPAGWDDQGRPCGHLPIRDEVIDGVRYMLSRWEPTPAELADLNGGGSLELRISGVVHPVVSLVVQPPGIQS